MIDLDLAAVFLAGVLTFFAPCTLPLIPAFIALISPNGEFGKQTHIGTYFVVRNALLFVCGFSLMFVGFGILAGIFGSVFVELRFILSQLGGVLIIILGLVMLNMINISLLKETYRFSLPRGLEPGNPLSCFLTGAAFSLAWTPCVGPLLAAVLLLAAIPSTAPSGGMLLGFFSVGLAIPFLVMSILYAQSRSFFTHITHVTKFVHVFGGVFLITLGLLLLTGNFVLLIEYGYRLFEALGLDGLFTYF